MFDAESRRVFVKPATAFKPKWNSELSARIKLEASTRNLRSGLQNLTRPTKTWNRLPILFRTTCARHFAIRSGTRSCYKNTHLRCSMTRVVGTYKPFSSQQEEWVT